MKDIAICGNGGLAREITCLIAALNAVESRWRFIGYFNEYDPDGCCEYGRVIGGIDQLNAWPTPLDIAIGVGDPAKLAKISAEITNPLVGLPNLISPAATIFDPANMRMGRGNVVFPGAVLSCGVRLGDCNFINYGVTVGHDARLGSYNALMPGVRISGAARVGDRCFFGLNSAVLQGLAVADGARLGAGAILIRDAEPGRLYLGIPARAADNPSRP